MLALAEPGVARFFGGEFLWGEAAAFVGAVAEGLVCGESAGAIPVVLAFLEGDFRGGFGGAVWCVFHGDEFSTRFAGGNPRISPRADC